MLKYYEKTGETNQVGVFFVGTHAEQTIIPTNLACAFAPLRFLCAPVSRRLQRFAVNLLDVSATKFKRPRQFPPFQAEQAVQHHTAAHTLVVR
jgi:hypothetical protein